MIPKPRPPRLNCLSLILFSAALPLQGIYADDGISRILQAWNEHYGTFAESKQYHYRCVVKRICKKPGFSLNRCQLPAVQELGLEIFLSDLGREYRYDNGDNRPVNILLMLALGVAGTGTMLYAWRLPDLFQRPGSRRFATLALACGVLAGWSYIRIGLAPLDVQHDEHHFFAIAGFVSFAAMGLSYAVALLLEADYPNRYGWSLLALCALLGAYVLLREFEGPHWLSASALFWKATAQKVVVYCQVLCMAIQAKGGLNWLDRRAAKDAAGPVP
ncbi:MAG TPA: hypothetical protein VNH11_17115 [Pirellulales bacterium]|nr:hypothetical protein [Pirellulales bacterium]